MMNFGPPRANRPPSPTLPARGRVHIEAVALSLPIPPGHTSPLAGEVGSGVGTRERSAESLHAG